MKLSNPSFDFGFGNFAEINICRLLEKVAA